MPGATQNFDAVVIGAGFSGLYMLKSLRDRLGLKVRVYEAGETVGGTRPPARSTTRLRYRRPHRGSCQRRQKGGPPRRASAPNCRRRAKVFDSRARPRRQL